jgi:hypothetical protein
MLFVWIVSHLTPARLVKWGAMQVESDYSNEEMKDVVKAGTLKKLTVAVLKPFCAQIGVANASKMKKGELVEAIESWAATA